MSVNFHLWVLVFCSYCIVINGYINVRLEDKLCATGVKGSGITLLDHSESAAIFTQQWNSSLSTSSYSNKVRYDCEFKVQSQKDAYRIPRGTYTIITHIKFRKIGNECLDYIQFHNEDGSSSERICGDTFKDGPINHFILDHRFLQIKVLIHIDSSTEIREPLELRMVMTAHSQCTHNGDFLCDETMPYSCISRHFFRDNVTNCMPPCRDELFCLQDALETKPIDSNNNKNPTKQTRDQILRKETRKEGIILENEARKQKDIILENEAPKEQFGKIRIADDSSNCITVKHLEEKLKENNEVLRGFMKDSEASLSSQILDVRISDKDVETPNYDDNEEDTSKCVTREHLEEKLEENTDFLIEAIKKSETRLSSKIDEMLFEYKKDLVDIAEDVERLKRRRHQTSSKGVY